MSGPGVDSKPDAQLRRQNAGSSRSAWKTAWYNFLHVLCRLLAVSIFGFRSTGRSNQPQTGPLLVLSNHQSHLDPVLIGLTLDRRLNFLARSTLFHFPPFRRLIESLDAIPIDREGLGLSGLKETLARLKRGEAVLLFPEGTRTESGELGPLKPGFCALARRHHVIMLPTAIRGAFAAWPKGALLPRLAPIEVRVASPLYPDLIAQLSDEQLVEEVRRRIAEQLYCR